jgi:hypothetical protein
MSDLIESCRRIVAEKRRVRQFEMSDLMSHALVMNVRVAGIPCTVSSILGTASMQAFK